MGRDQRDETFRTIFFPANSGKVGATAGFAFANNQGTATVPQSQSGSTLTIPLIISKGDNIIEFRIRGQIESGGGTVTVDADLRVTTGGVADLTDASIGSINQISVTADTLLNGNKTGMSHTIITGNSYYVLVTVTTAGTTDVNVQGIEVLIKEFSS